ncbi:matrix metalloproteinase-21-like [Diadema setosum]|uniref:matrix metalloproteinase-21-like n=1 Tax=Diadema setosum TaxID=31175 RepID=UPI003B3AFD7D
MRSVSYFTISCLLLGVAHVAHTGVIGSRTTGSLQQEHSKSASSSTSSSSPSSSSSTVGNLSEQQALKFLSEYGYIDRISTTAKNELKKTGSRARPVAPSATQATEAEVPLTAVENLQSGIEVFQRRYHLPVTGVIDAATKAIMSKPRCGVPDYSPAQDTANKSNPDGKDQSTESKGQSTGAGEQSLQGKGRSSEAVTPEMVTDIATEISTSIVPADNSKELRKSVVSKVLGVETSKSEGKESRTPVPPALLDPTAKDGNSADSMWDQFSIQEISSLMDEDPSQTEQEVDNEELTTSPFPVEEVEDTTILLYTVTDTLSTLVEEDGDLTTVTAPTETEPAEQEPQSDKMKSRRRRDLRETVRRAMAEKPLHRERRNTYSRPGGNVREPSGAGMRLSANNLPITWRVLDAYKSQYISDSSNIFYTAFRRWAEVTPLTFAEQTTGDVLNVDISIAFLQNSNVQGVAGFSWSSGQLARSDIPTGRLFFNDEQQWTDSSDQDYNLLTVAVHEIGHFLGLSHSTNNGSIMYPIYSGYNWDVRIDSETKTAVQAIYGKCNDSFDAAFDWVRPAANNRRVYSTYFFRNKWSWLYLNSKNETKHKDPKAISQRFSGVKDDIDAVVQIIDRATNDRMYFFKGNRYWRYDHANTRVYTSTVDGVTWSAEGRLISEGWPAKSGGSTRIPDNIDAAYHDMRDDNIYFFKGSLVYAYDMQADGCCLDGYPKPISEAYPGHNWFIPSLPDNIDSAYYSIKQKKLFFFKGALYWENTSYNPNLSTVLNKVGQSAQWNTRWKDVCNVE